MANPAHVWQTEETGTGNVLQRIDPMTAPHRLFLLVLLALLGAALPLVGPLGQEERPEGAAPGLVLVSTVKGAISPATAKQIADAIALAEEREAELLVIRLDTPGGLVTSTRDI